MTDLTTFQPQPNAADAVEVELELTDGNTGATHTIPATVRPRGLTPRTQGALLRAALISKRDTDEVTPEDILQVDEAQTAALAELVEAWDVQWEGVEVEPGDASVLPLAIRAALLAAVQKAVNTAPKGKPKQSAAPTPTARKPRAKS